jgi:DNA invertase Pin-like site-specific DNA recombinase
MARSKKVAGTISIKSKDRGQGNGNISETFVFPPQTMGYARVSTSEQSLDMQITALKAAGVPDEPYRLFREKVSAAGHRPQLSLLMKMLRKGDTLYVYSFSRLSRELKKLLILMDELRAKGVTIRSTSEPHIDPHTTSGRLVLSMTGAIDENERRRLRERTTDGMTERKRQGVSMGRPRLVTPEVAAQMQKLRNKRISVSAIASQFKVKPSTVYANTR